MKNPNGMSDEDRDVLAENNHDIEVGIETGELKAYRAETSESETIHMAAEKIVSLREIVCRMSATAYSLFTKINHQQKEVEGLRASLREVGTNKNRESEG